VVNPNLSLASAFGTLYPQFLTQRTQSRKGRKGGRKGFYRLNYSFNIKIYFVYDNLVNNALFPFLFPWRSWRLCALCEINSE
jgi:hypothetical protein